MNKSRRLRLASIETGLPENYGYCRVCQKVKQPQKFFSATDKDLDKNGLFSICKECCDTIYKNILFSENGNIQKTILKMCRMLNIKFNPVAIDSALKQIESKSSDPEKLFGLYKAKLVIQERDNPQDKTVDLTYQDIPIETIAKIQEVSNIEQTSDMKDVRSFWGRNFEKEELEILEGKFSDWSKSHSIDTQSERVLLKFICLKEFEIDKSVESGSSTASLMKEFQDLLKTSALSPNSSNASSGGKSMDAFGVWLKEIGEMRPEEWVEDKSIYKDVDNIEDYNERIIISPLRAFVTGSREFSLDADEVMEEEVEGE